MSHTLRTPSARWPGLTVALAVTLAAALALLLSSCATPPPAARPAPAAPSLAAHELPPPEPREFRAAWVATVANIDWPSAPGLSAAAMQAEALALLDRAQALGLNAIVLQVRPGGDAIYPSTLEPWSEFLSGAQGRPPWGAAEPPWDPLAFWLREAHRRGLELHAWLNPYRARPSTAKSPLVAPHLGVREPGLVKRYGDQLWMDPGEPAAAAHTLAVLADVLRRYDIDGVHIDDYFYPYPIPVPGAVATPGTPVPELPFPDDESYARYQAGGGTLARDDWRRANVDGLVQALYQRTRELRPQVRVGISPFGLGRPDRRAPGIAGFSQYDKLYADVEKWFQAGWLDYLAPQLYWPIARPAQAFQVLLEGWIAENSAGRHLWPGLFTSQTTRGEALGPRSWPAREVLDQVALLRARAPAAGGHIHFSMVALMQDRDGLATQLRAGPYARPALVPATPWLDDQPPPPPLLALDGAQATITPAAGEPAARWAVWRRIGGQWQLAVLPAAQRRIDLAGADALVVSAVDRVGNTSTRNVVALPVP